MFGVNDIPKFLLAFFLVMPVISILHEAGHVFFAWLMGGKKISVTVGSGKPVFKLGIVEVRQYYFWYGLCTFENINRKKKFTNILIFIGVLVVISLIENEILEAGIPTYQFTYFSLYYIIFALLPMPYPDGNYSDGKVILDLLRGKEEVVEQRTYRIQWQTKGEQWHVMDHNNKFIESFEKEEDALEKARIVAQDNRPSRIINTNGDEEKEVQNYPKIPL